MRAVLLAAICVGYCVFGGALAQAENDACLVTRDPSSSYEKLIVETSKAAAAELGVSLSTYSGHDRWDAATQIAAIETCVAGGAKSILIAPADPSALVPPLRRAREAGLLVVALDTPLYPAEEADATFATEWSIVADKVSSAIGEDSIVAAVSGYAPDGKSDFSGLESLLNGHQPSLTVFGTGDFGRGFVDFVQSSGHKDKVNLVAVDGSCNSLNAIDNGLIKAAVIPNPRGMAVAGVKSALEFAKSGVKPDPEMFNSSPIIVTRDATQASMDSKSAYAFCYESGDDDTNTLLWTAAKDGGDDCPKCSAQGACPQAMLLAKKECCKKNGACPQ